MKIYKVGVRDTFSEHKGYLYCTTKRAAITEWEKTPEEVRTRYGSVDLEEFEITLTKQGVLSFLNIHCSHPDNG